jgi:hypothetical protein
MPRSHVTRLPMFCSRIAGVAVKVHTRDESTSGYPGHLILESISLLSSDASHKTGVGPDLTYLYFYCYDRIIRNIYG